MEFGISEKSEAYVTGGSANVGIAIWKFRRNAMWPRLHSPQTPVSFGSPIRLHYARIGGKRWKSIRFQPL
jgi:hypothetical protein